MLPFLNNVYHTLSPPDLTCVNIHPFFSSTHMESRFDKNSL